MAIASWTALAASLAALFTAAFSVIKWRDEARARNAALADQRDQWTQTFKDQRERGAGEWQVTFLRELVTRRLGVYPSLLKTLSAVRYYSDGSLELAREDLRNAERELLAHLYGEAGLVMSARTREEVHGARSACREYIRQESDESLNKLINAFYDARHWLRADIQIGDAKSFQTQIDDMSRPYIAAGARGAPVARGRGSA